MPLFPLLPRSTLSRSAPLPCTPPMPLSPPLSCSILSRPPRHPQPPKPPLLKPHHENRGRLRLLAPYGYVAHAPLLLAPTLRPILAWGIVP